MNYPSEKEFLKLAKKGNLIPVYREILADLETPASAFMKIDRGRYSYLLESVEGAEKLARYSFMGSAPSLVFKAKGKKDPLVEIKKIMDRYKFVPVKGLPRFCGGLVGFLGYDTVRFFERLPDENSDDLKIVDSIFVLTDTLLIFDHLRHTIKIVSNVFTEDKKSKAALLKSYKQAGGKIEKIIKQLQTGRAHVPKALKSRAPLKIRSNFSKKAFKESVSKAKRYIRSGDIVQTVLSQRFKVKIKADAFSIYRVLRSINPSPYMYYLKFGDVKIVGSSPEIMVRCEDGVAEVRPIAGTRPRGATARKDAALEKELLRDPKERAEHVMLVDLGRNDIGRVCEFSSVKVPEFMSVEKYSHVMHIVSDVVGKLKRGKTQYDLLRATFPAGTVTGAPKIRAMEIIDELENKKRGPYAGAIGYFSFSGNIDTCITIRTILIKDGYAYVQAGAGIVADSVPEREYQETVNKARAMFKAIEIASGLRPSQ